MDIDDVVLARLLLEEERAAVGLLIACSGGRLTVDFPSGAFVRLACGRHYDLRLARPGRSMEVRAELVFRGQDLRRCRAELAVDPDSATGLEVMIEGRSAWRVGPRERVTARVRSAAGEERTLDVIDLSGTGLGLAAGPDDLPFLVAAKRCDVALDLVETGERLELGAVVRSAHAHTSPPRVGLEFDAGTASRYLEALVVLERWMDLRRAEILDRLA